MIRGNLNPIVLPLSDTTFTIWKHTNHTKYHHKEIDSIFQYEMVLAQSLQYVAQLKFSFRNNNISVFVFCSPFDVPHETEVIPFNYHHHTAFILIKKFYVNLEFYVDLILCWLGLRKIVFNANSVC